MLGKLSAKHRTHGVLPPSHRACCSLCLQSPPTLHLSHHLDHRAHRPNRACPLFLKVTFYWNTAFIYVFIYELPMASFTLSDLIEWL